MVWGYLVTGAQPKCAEILAVIFCIFRKMDLEKVIKNLFDSLAFKLETSPSNALTQEFLAAAGRFENMINFLIFSYFYLIQEAAFKEEGSQYREYSGENFHIWSGAGPHRQRPAEDRRQIPDIFLPRHPERSD